MPLLLAACPSFGDRWRAHRDYWGDDEPPLYADLGVFADHIVQLAKSGETDELPAAFDVIERLHVEGDPYVAEAATIGLLEGIQNLSGHAGIDLETFRPYLKPTSARYWSELIAFWDG